MSACLCGTKFAGIVSFTSNVVYSVLFPLRNQDDSSEVPRILSDIRFYSSASDSKENPHWSNLIKMHNYVCRDFYIETFIKIIKAC